MSTLSTINKSPSKRVSASTDLEKVAKQDPYTSVQNPLPTLSVDTELAFPLQGLPLSVLVTQIEKMTCELLHQDSTPWKDGKVIKETGNQLCGASATTKQTLGLPLMPSFGWPRCTRSIVWLENIYIFVFLRAKVQKSVGNKATANPPHQQNTSPSLRVHLVQKRRLNNWFACVG